MQLWNSSLITLKRRANSAALQSIKMNWSSHKPHTFMKAIHKVNQCSQLSLPQFPSIARWLKSKLPNQWPWSSHLQKLLAAFPQRMKVRRISLSACALSRLCHHQATFQKTNRRRQPSNRQKPWPLPSHNRNQLSLLVAHRDDNRDSKKWSRSRISLARSTQTRTRGWATQKGLC